MLKIEFVNKLRIVQYMKFDDTINRPARGQVSSCIALRNVFKTRKAIGMRFDIHILGTPGIICVHFKMKRI